MVGGPLVGLAAVGQLNQYTSINPDTTFFKGTYKRHTNFVKAPVEQSFNGGTNFGKTMNLKIDRAGDMIAQMYIKMRISGLVYTPVDPVNDYAYFTNEVGHAVIKTSEINIGSQRFDITYGDFLAIWENLSHKSGKRLGSLIGYFNNVPDLVQWSLGQDVLGDGVNQVILYIPLQFWFNRSYEQALPLIALQYHDVRVDLSLRQRSEIIVVAGALLLANVTGGELLDISLLINYIYLEAMERRVLATNQHIYLISQLDQAIESKPAGKTTYNIQLYFNHICQELIWVLQKTTAIEALSFFDYSGNAANQDPLRTAKILLNNQEIMNSRTAIYYRQVVNWECHSQIPDRYIYVFAFALDPENWKPTGGINLSRIDNVLLYLYTQDFEGEIRVYGRHLNVIKIVSGMCGLKFAN